MSDRTVSDTNKATIKNFDSLPDSAHVRVRVVAELWGGVTPQTIWRNAKKGLIPAPKKLTPAITAWNVGELRASLAKAA